ncbi:pentapeptide repeat-containing protein [Arthrobacter sp. zg-Y820]|uniref:pentapeptide repeat-containing protein n=1 Tax=unclassified Arthrobacter TaxID=235627 RepID=UPI001E450565|nr:MULTISPECIES: pentapeptide repeat-containing protein [unclassified Arthrobacter]MCC9197772.1 pentapeptide repeat-containing protein [Arthrobacter sp. zg-Y820]MDK1280639.1 pentapeptide repeat-containing protein [Arthrobacter sp. zg.Y820]WIB10728.1 pentapeptide repeat-containing protein [Arthrobacter sp. zg-Y820]
MHSTSARFPEPASPARTRSSLRPDCANCFALCCTAFGFTRSADFALDKPAGAPCRNLASDFTCTIHDSLLPRGFRGCTVFDCFGAGQNVSHGLFSGKSWLENPGTKDDMFAAFKASRQLHEMLWYLVEAQARTFDPDASLRAARLRATIEHTAGRLPELLSRDIQELHSRVGTLLMEVSEEVRASYCAAGDDHLASELAPGADLMGSNFRSRRLCGADLRGAWLIAADLRGSDLSGVDLLGADLRDARLDGADLSQALYVTQPQLNSAKGSASTLLPPDLTMPPSWRNG